jgi:hypothetical protein
MHLLLLALLMLLQLALAAAGCEVGDVRWVYAYVGVHSCIYVHQVIPTIPPPTNRLVRGLFACLLTYWLYRQQPI